MTWRIWRRRPADLSTRRQMEQLLMQPDTDGHRRAVKVIHRTSDGREVIPTLASRRATLRRLA